MGTPIFLLQVPLLPTGKIPFSRWAAWVLTWRMREEGINFGLGLMLPCNTVPLHHFQAYKGFYLTQSPSKPYESPCLGDGGEIPHLPFLQL